MPPFAIGGQIGGKKIKIMAQKKFLLNDGRYNNVITNGYDDSEKNSGELLTRPNMTLSVAELLDRYTHGRPLPDNMIKNNNYGNLPMTGKKGFDLADVPALKKQLENDIATNTAELNRLKALDAENKAKQAEAEENAKLEKLKARLAESEKKSKDGLVESK